MRGLPDAQRSFSAPHRPQALSRYAVTVWALAVAASPAVIWS